MAGMDRRAVVLVVALAVAARVAAVLVLRSDALPHTTYEHGEIAANLLAGRGFAVRFLGADGPTSQQAPLYPLAVAAAYAVGGVETPRALLVLQLGQSLLGGALAAGVMALAHALAPGRRRVAIAAGLVAALHPTLVYAATHAQVALPAATLLAWAFALAARAGTAGRVGASAAAGLAFGLLVLTDPILGLAAPGLGLLLARGPACGATRLRPVAVAGLVAALTLLPWTWRNYRVHGELVAVKTTFGYAFWQGNCALSEGTDKVVRPSVEDALRRGASPGGGLDLRRLNRALWEARHVAGYIDDIALTPADHRTLGRLTEPERSRHLFRRALADLRAEPWRYPALCLRRLRFFVLFDETNPKTRNLFYRASHLGLTLGAAAGLLLAPPWLRRRLGPTLLTAVLIAAFHALTITSARFHIPLEPLMGLWAASALAGDRDRASPGAEAAGGTGSRMGGRRGMPRGRRRADAVASQTPPRPPGGSRGT